MPTNKNANEVHVGWIWQAGHGSQYEYEILSIDEEMQLRRLSDGVKVKRYIGQVTGFGRTYQPK